MDMALLVALAGLIALLTLGSCALLLVLSDRRRTRGALETARADLLALRARLEELEAARLATPVPAVAPATEYVITTAGDHERAPARQDAPQVPDRAVLSVTVGEPLVKAVAFGYGVRRALSAESRNRILFAMRREVRRTRKQRRKDARRAAREAVA